MSNITLRALTVATLVAGGALSLHAQESAADSVMNHTTGSRLTIGGYGEVAYSRNFYSDNGYRYSRPATYKDDKSHGRFDIPHAVIYLGYNFGKGWSFGTEIEFEHGGTGSAVEYESDESIEYENETEKGGEVELEQFWLQKSFGNWLNVRAGHIVVPFGLVNAHHEPLNFFTVYRPEGENTILPSTWHQTGVSLWGKPLSWLRYEAQFLAGLDAFKFNRLNWIGEGTSNPFEFEVANKYGGMLRLDFYPVDGLRVGLSGYYGRSMHNSYPHDMEKGANKKIHGNVYLGAIDFTFNRYNLIVRGNADYGYVSDADAISRLSKPQTQYVKPYESTWFGSHAIATSIEAGYDIFSFFPTLKAKNQKFYVFGHYEYYDSYIGANTKTYTRKRIYAGGVNYYPIPQIGIKAEYNYRDLDSRYNPEPSVNIGVVYEGFFDIFGRKHRKACAAEKPQTDPQLLERMNEMQREIDELKQRKPETHVQTVTQVEHDVVDGRHVVTFAQGSNALSSQAKATLDKISAGATVDVEAYASPEGSEGRNHQLSDQRAQAVKDYLQARGVNVASAVSKGAQDEYSNRIAIVTVRP